MGGGLREQLSGGREEEWRWERGARVVVVVK